MRVRPAPAPPFISSLLRPHPPILFHLGPRRPQVPDDVVEFLFKFLFIPDDHIRTSSGGGSSSGSEGVKLVESGTVGSSSAQNADSATHKVLTARAKIVKKRSKENSDCKKPVSVMPS
jgi:hypothetical protein